MPVPAGTALRAAGTATGTGLRRAYAGPRQWSHGLVGPAEPGAVAVGGAGRGGGGVPVPVSVHPQAIDLSQLDGPTAVGSGRLPVSATLLVCLPAIIPTLWMGGMVLLALAVRY
jgi:hypothetical protein